MKKLLLHVLLTASMILLVASAAMAGSSSFTANTYTPSGTAITNSATVAYKDSNNTVQTGVTSNTVTTTVTQIYGVVVTPATDAKTGTDGLTYYYTVTVYNNGNGSDTFDLSSAKTGGTWATSLATTFYSDVAHTLPITKTGSIAQNGNQVVYMSVTIPAGQIDASTNVTTATATSEGTGHPSDTDVCTTTVTSDVFTTSTKTSSTASPEIGVPFTYTITVNNTGTTASTGTTTISDIIGSGATANLTYVASSTKVGGVSINDGNTNGNYTVTWTAGTHTLSIADTGAIATSGTVVITFQATANSGSGGTPVTNTATITYDNGSYSPTVSVTPLGEPVLGLAKTVDKPTAAPGAVLTYTITATNSGGSPATNVVISDNVPANTTYLGNIMTGTSIGTLASGGGTQGSGTVTSNAVTIAPAGTWVLQFQVTVQ